MGEKTSCLLDRKVGKKNWIPEYHAPSPEWYDKDWYVGNQLMKNLLTWGDNEQKNRKSLWSVIGEKPPNLVGC